MDGRTDGPMDGLTNGWMDGRTDEQTDGHTDGQTDGRTDQRMDGWTDGPTDQRTDKASYRFACPQLKMGFETKLFGAPSTSKINEIF